MRNMDDERIVYSRLLTTAKDSEDGESPERLTVFQESQGIFLYYESFKTGLIPLSFFREGRKNEAIEVAVAMSVEEIRENAKQSDQYFESHSK